MAGERRNLSPSIPMKRSRRNMSVEGDGASYPIAETVHINSLPDDVLGSVLSQLTTEERVGVEAVSRRWRNISRQYAWRSQTRLDITESLVDDATTTGTGPNLSHADRKKIFMRRFECLFDRCSSHLRSLRMSMDFYYSLTDATIVDLICTARHLITLELVDIPLTVRAVSLIGRRLPTLESLSLPGCLGKLSSSNAERALMAIMQGCRLLQKLDISRNMMLTGERFFAQLPPTLQSLNISWCIGLNFRSVTEHLRTACVNGRLRKLDVSALSIGGPLLRMGRLFEELPLLEGLVYGYVYRVWSVTPQENAAAMAKIGSMKRLKTLDLRNNQLITDEVLKAILSGCTELTSLSFDYMGGSSGDKLLEVVADSHLRLELSLSALDFKDGTIRRILRRCRGLRALEINHCNGITRATVRAIGKFVAGIAQSPTTTDVEQSFYLSCDGSSIDARPGELETELLAAHPVLKSVRQRDSHHGETSKPTSLEIRW